MDVAQELETMTRRWGNVPLSGLQIRELLLLSRLTDHEVDLLARLLDGVDREIQEVVLGLPG